MINKKKKIVILILLVLSLFALNIFVKYDDFLYKTDILKITKIDTVSTEYSYNDLGIREKHYERKITGIITNGKNKGKIKTIKYDESSSSVVSDKYRIGDKVFIKSSNIEELKRDSYVTLIVSLFIITIYMVGSINGLLSVFSVIINSFIFYFGLQLYFKGVNILLLCLVEMIIFSFLSLFIAAGVNKKTLAAITSSIICIFVLLIMLLIITKTTNYKGVNFNELSFLTVPPEDIILPEVLIGALGAIMDVSITMSSSISELIEKDHNISIKNLRKSSKQIGKDIMSTMINVLFFTYLCAGLPIFVLAVRNGYTISNYITSNFSLELTRFLVGSIGIVMSIPIGAFTSIKMFKGELL